MTAPDQMSPLRRKLYEVIFGTDTPAGKTFDLVLIAAILLSVAAILVDSIPSVHLRFKDTLKWVEWSFTLVFTLEYLVRIYCSPNPRRYIFSFYGLVDLLSILPSYIGLVYPAARHFIVLRILRVLRIFRILKLIRYMGEANLLFRALNAARRKIFIFLFWVMTIVVVFGALMFIIEGPANGFTSIPRSIYWAVVTITTVGYGDITPHTPLGQAIASLAMLTGYAIIAVPTGIISAELFAEVQHSKSNRVCKHCARVGHDLDARYCKHCGEEM